MSLQTGPKKILINSLSAATLNVTGAGPTETVTIMGLPPFLVSSVESCYKACSTPCVPQVFTITPVPPDTTCECPWMWEMAIVKKQCTATFGSMEVYPGYQDIQVLGTGGAIPTVAQIVVSAVAQINGNPDSPVTAVNNGNATITLTEKACSGDYASCGFSVFGTSMTIVATTPHTAAVLSSEQVMREWPITPGSFFQRPNTALCGTYCRYYLKINPINKVNDVDLVNATVDRYLEVEIYVNNMLPTFAADFDTPLLAAVTCLSV